RLRVSYSKFQTDISPNSRRLRRRDHQGGNNISFQFHSNLKIISPSPSARSSISQTESPARHLPAIAAKYATGYHSFCPNRFALELSICIGRPDRDPYAAFSVAGSKKLAHA